MYTSTVMYPREPISFSYLLYTRSGSSVVHDKYEYCAYGILCKYHVCVVQVVSIQH
jgi:hypothetical protein